MKVTCTPNRKHACQLSFKQDDNLQTASFVEDFRLFLQASTPRQWKPETRSAAPVSLTVPEGMKRSLLQMGNGSELNSTLWCEGCPETDTRVPVNDSMRYPWTAVGMVTRNQSSGTGKASSK